ncbi:dynamin-related protein 4C [Artemisia annua]|uniref:Dynamin-related protein 4C n=1 Tax=Artemisia annua TaxID=35608 RepID=A0A2U1Q088_ARTAN|nr:dynamin-related protein 4C [Artemisia annua]
MEYIKPEETIILNVLSATVDFPTCESIRMSQKVDKTGERTLAVVTKADKAPEGLLEKVTADDVNIGLGYICVRNRIGDESHEEARIKETALFETHSLLSKIDKSMVGIPVLANKLAYIQSKSISKCLPNIVQKIKEKLNLHVLDLNKLPHHPATTTEAMAIFMQIIGSSKDSLRKLLIAGEFDEYVDDLSMHSTARLSKMLNELYNELQNTSKIHFLENFLVDEILVLEEANGIWLPNFIPRSTFQSLMRKKIDTISQIPVSFIEKVWDHIESVVVRVLASNCEHYPQLRFAIKRSAQNTIARTKDRFKERVLELVEMETVSDYSCDPEFLASWAKSRESLFHIMNKGNWPLKIEMQGYGVIEAGHLRPFREVDSAKFDQAFDLKMRMAAYWNIVVKRLVDYIALQLQYTIQSLVKKDLDGELAYEVVGGIEQMLEESPSIATKRERLKKSIEVLMNSNEVIEKAMDMIAFLGD